MWSKSKRTGGEVVLGLAAAVVFFAAGMAPEPEEADQKGIVTFVEGSARKQKVTEEEWHRVLVDSTVISGERVRTFSESRAELEIARLDRVRMAPRTTIDILKLYEETVEQERESAIVLQSGELWAHVGKKSGAKRFSITTPVAAAAITGTTLRLSVGADSSTELRVYAGEVVLSRVVGQDSIRSAHPGAPHQVPGPAEVAAPREVTLEEWRLIVRSMQRVRVDGRGEVVQSGSFSPEDPDEQSDWVNWNRARDQKL